MAPPMDLVSLLAGAPLFEMLSNQELEAMASVLVERRFDKGATIFAEGALGDGLYVVAQGEVEVLRHGGATPLATLGPGDTFGEMALVDTEYRSATVRASSDTVTLQLTPEAFTRFRKEHREGCTWLILNIARLLSVRLREANLRLARAGL